MVFTWLWGRQIVILLGTIIKFQRTRFFLGFFWWLRTWKPIRPGFSTCLRFPSLFIIQTKKQSWALSKNCSHGLWTRKDVHEPLCSRKKLRLILSNQNNKALCCSNDMGSQNGRAARAPNTKHFKSSKTTRSSEKKSVTSLYNLQGFATLHITKKMYKVCTEAVHSVALWTRVTLHVWACVKCVPKQSIP